MRRVHTLSLLAVIVLYSGCSTHQADAKIDFKPPKYVEQVPPRENVRSIYNPGSLFGRGDNPVFSDKKAMNVNDIVTVVINENILSSSSGSKKIKRTTNDKLGGAVFAGGPGALAGKVNKVSDISVGIDSSNTFQGSGSNQRQEKFTTTISARIIKILENGNYFIDGRREMLLDGQKQVLHVSGVIRPEDISQTNMIDSKYIADAKILYETQGDVKEATEKGWGTKAVESIWPF
ncbi:flagellar basal body L-ring protein FlgH [Hydrogenimonas sp. SS33]|uniref:flagellar basal body L-ring protein FlgH n=1 Tax=Hydrogenimonas leucolamina TaxID=2954236 RepID=UPI00336C1EB8